MSGSADGRGWAWRRRMVFGILALVLVPLLTSVLVPSVRHAGLRTIGHFLDVGETPRPCDAVWLLNGDSNSRPLAAARLVREGYANRIVFTDTASFDQHHDFEMPEHERTLAMIEFAGVSRDVAQLVPKRAKSTYDEAQAAGDWLKDHPGAVLAVVTSDYHTRRTRWVFRRFLDDDQFFMVSAPTDGFNVNNWWRHRHGFSFYLGEYAKFVIYHVRYRPWFSAFWVLLTTLLISFAFRRLRSGRSVSRLAGEMDVPPTDPSPA
ncbi:MAG: YdcF family protein [Planctomycetota bacterium]